MAPKFGTSGLRGLVTQLTPDLTARYVQAFLTTCQTGTGLFVGRDLRPSSPGLTTEVIAAARRAGVAVTDCGALPTPALAMAAMAADAAAIMVTGSHIPADRNGLKFYLPTGEITKNDEAAISAACGAGPGAAREAGTLATCSRAADAYVARYVSAYGARALAGMRLGVYQHSSVARDLLVTVLDALGATVVAFARSEVFIPLDTEAVAPGTRSELERWSAARNLDAVLSTDGDGDRPLLGDARGTLIPGDILGVLTALALGAEVVCTPVSSNSMVQEIARFGAVHRTRIGSPFVIAAMHAAREADPGAKVVGFEANGGFLLGFEAQGPAGRLAPLMTRDAFLPLIAPLAAARAQGRSLADLCHELPPRVTAAAHLVDVPAEAGAAFLAQLSESIAARAAFLVPLGREADLDRTDGLRMTLAEEGVVHLRPSGNAPEFRVYVEATSSAKAQDLLDRAIRQVERSIRRE